MRAPKRKLKSLHTDKKPILLDEILPNMKIGTLRRWFIENLVESEKRKPIVIIDKRQRRIWITEKRFDHLINTDDKKGNIRRYYEMKAKCLNLIRPCIENPIEMWRNKSGAVVYISAWKIIPKTRYVVICRRNNSAWELKTHMHLEDKTVESWRNGFTYEWDPP